MKKVKLKEEIYGCAWDKEKKVGSSNHINSKESYDILLFYFLTFIFILFYLVKEIAT